MVVESFHAESDGLSVTGLSPSWVGLKRESNSVDVSQPAISEVGLGWYRYDVTIPSDDRVLGVIDCGVSLSDTNRYVEIKNEYFNNKKLLTEIDAIPEQKEVFVLPIYDGDTDVLTFFVYLMQNGQITTASLSDVEINVYTSTHALSFQLTSTSETNGIFVVTKSNPTLSAASGYYVKAKMTMDDSTEIESVETYVALS